ncbi:MAG TPA: thioredoxin [Actinomycetota bacterium]|nr:thioredoxin [Actinomycetota bacterium]
MALIGDVTDQDFEERVLGSERPVLVDFWAEWCVPCHMVSPVVEEIGRDKGDDLQVAKLNIDENPDVTRKYGVMSIPTLMLFKDGQEIARVVGARGKDALLKEIDPHVAA